MEAPIYNAAADASFSKNSKRGSASVKNVVDATKGKITNVIDFHQGNNSNEAAKEPLVKQLNVVIAANAASKSRLGLEFKYAKVVLSEYLASNASGTCTFQFRLRLLRG